MGMTFVFVTSLIVLVVAVAMGIFIVLEDDE